jgi:hypothetical protein
MQFLRLEVYEKRDGREEVVFVREKPIFTETHRSIKTMNTKMLNWATKQFPSYSRIEINVKEK